jgi:hypothetical protein
MRMSRYITFVNVAARGWTLVLFVCSVLAGLCTTARVEAKTSTSDAAMVKRGEYLVLGMGCNDCHTPWKMGSKGPEPDMSKSMSGHPEGLSMPPAPVLNMPWAWAGSATMTAFAGPWGVSFAPNLTPDMETGIGAWDETVFIQAIRTGKLMGAGRPILPPMPYPWYSKLTDDDLKAMFAYLKTLPPIKNHVPDPLPPAAPPPGR